jgi:hypothetical protein
VRAKVGYNIIWLKRAETGNPSVSEGWLEGTIGAELDARTLTKPKQ